MIKPHLHVWKLSKLFNSWNSKDKWKHLVFLHGNMMQQPSIHLQQADSEKRLINIMTTNPIKSHPSGVSSIFFLNNSLNRKPNKTNNQ